MRRLLLPLLLTLSFFSSTTLADDYRDTVKMFQASDAPSAFFKSAYGYAVFPTIGKAGFFIGGAYGEGRVYKHNKYTGTTTMTQASIGFQLGGQAYSQVIFFEDARAYNEFTSGNFEFSAQASAIAITAGASAEAGTKGTGASASGGQNNAATSAHYYRGMATFVIAKGGLMYEAAIAGQKFSFTPK